jgi:(4S)-4-hydroxy-5-phosphonooxypentane-2,3-dione isomerase
LFREERWIKGVLERQGGLCYAILQSSNYPVLQGNYMLAVHVTVQVKQDCIDAFIAATAENAQHSLQEPGIARFDVVQDRDDPAHFVLVEVYKEADAPARHKATAHYAKWRDTVAGMMAVPRSSVKFETLCPENARWETIHV